MFKKYKKTDAPAWERKLVLFLGALLGATLLLFVAWAITLFVDWARVSGCPDAGGTYDDERSNCAPAQNSLFPND